MKPIVAISMGDASGIGPEIAVKALSAHRWAEKCMPVVVGDLGPIEDALRFTNSDLPINLIQNPHEARDADKCLNLVDMNLVRQGEWEYKKVQANCGGASVDYVRKAAAYAMDGSAHAIVTGPINKEAFNLAGIHFSGHTEILADLTKTKNYAMLLISGTLRIIHVTTHVSMRKACDLITQERVHRVIRLADGAMRSLGIAEPKIGVAGFNAHCSENGLFGDEEASAIIPAIKEAVSGGIRADGPVPPDTVFVKAQSGMYDVVVAMYHDQGHIPLKLSGFKLDTKTNRYVSMSGVNCTIGLPIIRTSVDHGTAFGKAGEGRANEESLVDAMNIAITMAKAKFGWKTPI
jgi:4-hydroxythreonine-4-phosphate dehydrogenase